MLKTRTMDILRVMNRVVRCFVNVLVEFALTTLDKKIFFEYQFSYNVQYSRKCMLLLHMKIVTTQTRRIS